MITTLLILIAVMLCYELPARKRILFWAGLFWVASPILPVALAFVISTATHFPYLAAWSVFTVAFLVWVFLKAKPVDGQNQATL